MLITELSNPNSIASSFELVQSTSNARTYKNTQNKKILNITFFEAEYEFLYNNNYSNTTTPPAEAIQVFKTVLYDFKTYVIDKNKKSIYFSADKSETSRVKLYNMLARMIEKQNYIRITEVELLPYYFTQYDINLYTQRLQDPEGGEVYLFVKKDSNIRPII